VSFSPRVSRSGRRALALQEAHLLPQHEDLDILVAVALPRAEGQIDA
jgi:hypothetical protein